MRATMKAIGGGRRRLRHVPSTALGATTLAWLCFVPVALAQEGGGATRTLQEAPTVAQPRALAETEPNNSFAEATPIAVRGSTQGTIAPMGDADWYRIDASHHGQIEIHFEPVPAELDIAFRLWDAEKATISAWTGAARAGAAVEALLDVPSAGQYFLEVVDGGGDARAAEPYTMTHAFTASVDVGEPNNAFGAGYDIAATDSLDATILPIGDVDWYCLAVDHHGELAVALVDPPETMDLNLRAWNADKATITSWFAPLSAGGDTRAVIDLPAPGRYCIETADGGGNARSIEPYRMETVFTPSVDNYEPNNSFGLGAAIAPDSDIDGTILPVGDTDWYCLVVEHHGELAVNVAQSPDALDVNFRVWTADKATLTGWHSPPQAGADFEEIVDLPAPGRYCLEVVDGRGDARAIEAYRIETVFTPSPDTYEPNNHFGAATAIAVDGKYDATILPVGDDDWYCFAVGRHGELTVGLIDPPENLDLHFRVWTADKSTLTGWFAPPRIGAGFQEIVDIPAPGSYCLEVADGRDDGRAIAPYRLVTAYAPSPDAFEPNGSFGSAAALAPNGELQATILPKGDADWYAIDVDRPGALEVLIVDVPRDLDIAARVWNASKSTISSWFRPLSAGGDTELLIDLPAAGRYFLEVRDGRDDGRAIEPYSLQSRFAPTG